MSAQSVARTIRLLVEHTGMAKRGEARRKPRAAKRPRKPAVNLSEENAALRRELAHALKQRAVTGDALDATANLLKVINRSTFELQPVFEMLVTSAARLCNTDMAIILLRDGDVYRGRAAVGFAPDYLAFLASNPLRIDRGSMTGRVSLEKRIIQVEDVAADPEYRLSQVVTLAGQRTALGVPLLRDGEVIGVIVLARRWVEPFTAEQIELVATFADQAMIAIENTRLMTEQREALEQQTATAEILQVINSSPDDLAPVFDVILAKALRLCDAAFGVLWTYDGENFCASALLGVPPAFAEVATRDPRPAGLGTSRAPILRGGDVVHIADAAATEAYLSGEPMRRAVVDLGGARTLLGVPLRKDDALLGTFVIYRREVRPFSDKQIMLLQNFAAQAVIAMENARLLGELRQRTGDLARSVDELTATSDVLKTISRSSVDLETVLDTLSETVMRLCRADHVYMFRRRDDKNHLVASRGLSQEAKEFVHTHPFAPDRSTLSGRVSLERRVVHIPDVLQDPEYSYEGLRVFAYRTMLGVPLMPGDALIGVFVVSRTKVEPFTNKEIELATSFADQAVIAIENARLFDELRERQAELRVTFDNMGDGVAMFDSQQRLAAWNRNFQQILEMPDAMLAQRKTYTEYVRILAERGEFGAEGVEAELSRRLQDTGRELRLERTRPDGRVIEVRRNAVPGGGFVLIYADITERKRSEETIRKARDAAEAALRELQAAQTSLVHAQKMAALGQLTAGIAHEIKNPLNFVNNFAGLSVELLNELKAAATQAIGTLPADKRAEIDETIAMLTGNLEKIVEHGRRADGIVKSMLAHSRGGSGDWQATDLNALVEEALNLAYHGARAQDQSFNITMERDFDRNLGSIEVVPQDVTRVFLNLIGNGFYAANKRSSTGDGAFHPVLRVTTRDLGNAVEIGVRDNGVGIPPEHQEKLFQPFFTTKPTGEGTGLGLSISYEIITQLHGGTIKVDSEVGAFTEFTVRLPRRQHLMTGRVV
jgi:two-component system NtrC family sensor kinase